MVVQGVCPAPKGMAMRNQSVPQIWDTHRIVMPVSVSRAPMVTGSRNVAIQAYRSPTGNKRLTNGRARSIAAYNRQWLPQPDCPTQTPGMPDTTNLFSCTDWPRELNVPKVDRYRQTLTTLRANSQTDVPVLSRTSEWHRNSYTRTAKTFLPDVRFGKEWSHINFDGTMKNLSAGQSRSARRPATMG